MLDGRRVCSLARSVRSPGRSTGQIPPGLRRKKRPWLLCRGYFIATARFRALYGPRAGPTSPGDSRQDRKLAAARSGVNPQKEPRRQGCGGRMSGKGPTADNRGGNLALYGEGTVEPSMLSAFLSDVLLFSCLATFVTGIVIAVANLIN